MQPPLYQLATSPAGTWRVRVFNLPAHLPGQPATLPFLCALAAGPGPAVSDWHKDPGEQLTVLRLAGSDAASLTRLLSQLRSHGINRVGAGGAAG